MADSTCSDLDTLASIDRATDLLYVVDASDGTSNKITVNSSLGISGGDPVSTSDTQTLTNKTLTSPTLNTPTLTVYDSAFTIQDNSAPTKQAQFQASGITAGQTRVYTLPDYNATIATLAGTETFTNKTLTSPTINTATIVNPTITADALSEYTSDNGITLDSLNIKDGKLNTDDCVVTDNITDAAVVPDKLSLGGSTAAVATSETTTTTTYADLTTPGPSVTVTVGANGIVLLLLGAVLKTDTDGSNASMTYAASGANTIAAADANGTLLNNNSSYIESSTFFLLTGLTPGSTTFTVKYLSASGKTATFLRRKIAAIPL